MRNEKDDGKKIKVEAGEMRRKKASGCEEK